MARPLRLEFPGAIYHVTSRGDRREDIFDDDKDRMRWLELLGSVSNRFNWRCYAYCLMDNHYHIVIETIDGNLSKGMRQLNGVYTQYFNRRHGRVGHVFQGRFKGILVEKDTYLLELARYVVLNPVRAGMVNDIHEYPWSSYRATIGTDEIPDWLEAQWLLSHFSKQKKRAVAAYKNFVREGIGLPPIWDNLSNQVFLGSETFIENLQNELKKKQHLDEVPRIQKTKPAKSLTHYKHAYKSKNEAIAAAYFSGAYTQKEIGKAFGFHYSTVSRIVKQQEQKKYGKT